MLNIFFCPRLCSTFRFYQVNNGSWWIGTPLCPPMQALGNFPAAASFCSKSYFSSIRQHYCCPFILKLASFIIAKKDQPGQSFLAIRIDFL
jgi:hypothetical protein